MHLHDLSPFKATQFFDFSHRINRLSFGKDFPGMVNPLDGTYKDHARTGVQGMWQYYVKVVPTTFTRSLGRTLQTNQFSVTEHFKPVGGAERGIPGEETWAPALACVLCTAHRCEALLPAGIFFFYDLSPIKVRYTEKRGGFLHFLTNVCAIVGGVFTVSGLLEAFVYHVPRALRKKMEMGKFH